MRGGALRDQLVIQRHVQAGVNALNEPTMVWQTWAEPFCEVMTRRGREHFDPTTRQRYSEDVWRFRVRHFEVIGLDTTMKIEFRDMTFDIKAVLPDAQYSFDVIIECTTQDSALNGAPLSIAITEEIPDGEAAVVYAGFSVTGSGGSGTKTYAIAAGSLPTGLSLSSSTGAVSGTPTTPGAYPVTFKVTDSTGTATLPSVTITVS